MKAIFLTLKTFFSRFVKAQSVALLVSIPFLAHWGIPISIMTFIGNLLFTPILIIYLTLSSLIFATELCSIPNIHLITLLSQTSSFWELLLSYGKKTWLVALAKPDATLTVFIAIFIGLLALRFIFRIVSKLLIVAIIVVAVLSFTQYKSNITSHTKTVPIHKQFQKLFVSQHNKTIQITDNGLFNQKQSPEKFVNFELKPYLIKTYGTMTIENIILNKPSIRSFKATEELCETFTIKKVSIANATSLSKKTWKQFHALQSKLQKDGTTIERLEG